MSGALFLKRTAQAESGSWPLDSDESWQAAIALRRPAPTLSDLTWWLFGPPSDLIAYNGATLGNAVLTEPPLEKT